MVPSPPPDPCSSVFRLGRGKTSLWHLLQSILQFIIASTFFSSANKPCQAFLNLSQKNEILTGKQARLANAESEPKKASAWDGVKAGVVFTAQISTLKGRLWQPLP
jgi:hypothetical protein